MTCLLMSVHCSDHGCQICVQIGERDLGLKWRIRIIWHFLLSLMERSSTSAPVNVQKSAAFLL
jgi:hypothetical protein